MQPSLVQSLNINRQGEKLVTLDTSQALSEAYSLQRQTIIGLQTELSKIRHENAHLERLESSHRQQVIQLETKLNTLLSSQPVEEKTQSRDEPGSHIPSPHLNTPKQPST